MELIWRCPLCPTDMAVTFMFPWNRKWAKKTLVELASTHVDEHCEQLVFEVEAGC